MPSLYDFTVAAADHTPVPLRRYAGQVLLIVNVASRCGFTPQYAGLEALHQVLGPRGLTVLGFPCNQFGGQEPGDAAAIASFCATTYRVSFPVLAKIEVNGTGADPLYQWLAAQKPGLLGSRAIKWNFTKFVVSRRGAVLAREASTRTPEQLRPALEAALAEPAGRPI